MIKPAMSIEIFGIKINTEGKKELLRKIGQRVDSGQKTFIVTPYSEFFYRAFYDHEFKELLNGADFALPDGVAAQWLSYFLSIPLRAQKYYLKILESIFDVLWSGASIIFYPKRIRKLIPEKISGVDFFWDILALAEKKNLKTYFLGGFEETPELVAEKARQKFPQLQIAGFSNKFFHVGDLDKINQSGADLLFVAYGPVRQEKWIAEHLPELNIKLAIGLGGTFDYIAGKKIRAPKFIRALGLEWLFRLISQPKRFRRIWQGTYGIILGAIRQKVFMSMPYRLNAAGAIINNNGEIFVARRNAKIDGTDGVNYKNHAHWQFPQGGIEKHESPERGALREVFEETNMESLVILGVAKRHNYFFWNHPVRNLIANRLKYKGQDQAIVFLRYTGDNSDIKLDQRELVDFKWVPRDELIATVHPFRRKAAEIIYSEYPNFIK